MTAHAAISGWSDRPGFGGISHAVAFGAGNVMISSPPEVAVWFRLPFPPASGPVHAVLLPPGAIFEVDATGGGD